MPAKRRLTPIISRIAERGLAVSEDQIRAYAPSELEVRIAEAMLAGAATFKEIADDCKSHEATVSARMRDSVACAWVARHIHQQISHRLGLIDAAMMRRALAGDTRAAELLYKRYGKDVHYNVNLNVGAPSDVLAVMSDKALDALLGKYRGTITEVPNAKALPPPEPAGAPPEVPGGAPPEPAL